MNATMVAGGPSSTTNDSGNTQGGIAYDLGFSFVLLLFIVTICYTSYVCKRRNMWSRSPPPPTTSDDHCMRLYEGLEEDILSSFPTFLYSDKESHGGSGCSICLADYKATDVIRLLPECGHLFHVKCIDTWLKVHPACPVCRKSPFPTPTQLT